jgi:NAD(P)-dependent dehydrogenase (short-subunit alcohol dehydrogenase family)
MNFKGKIALITGSGSGIGRAAALLFAQKGADIMVSDINEKGGMETVKLVEDLGQKAVFCKTDVSSLEEVKTLIATTVETFGKIDIAVNNAGIGGDFRITHEYPVENYERVIAINQTGVFYCMQEELKQMVQQGGGGAIVNIASIAGLRAQPYTSAYTAAKHAVLGLTKTAAWEYARYKIRVNAVCPVFTRTPMVEDMLTIDPTFEKKLLRNIPLRRYGQPEDIANAIVWLCAEETGFITGHSMPVDGGMTA